VRACARRGSCSRACGTPLQRVCSADGGTRGARPLRAAMPQAGASRAAGAEARAAEG